MVTGIRLRTGGQQKGRPHDRRQASANEVLPHPRSLSSLCSEDTNTTPPIVTMYSTSCQGWPLIPRAHRPKSPHRRRQHDLWRDENAPASGLWVQWAPTMASNTGGQKGQAWNHATSGGKNLGWAAGHWSVILVHFSYLSFLAFAAVFMGTCKDVPCGHATFLL